MLVTQILLACRAVPPCRSETTRETYHTNAHLPCSSLMFIILSSFSEKSSAVEGYFAVWNENTLRNSYRLKLPLKRTGIRYYYL
jgi:hypothetical protein